MQDTGQSRMLSSCSNNRFREHQLAGHRQVFGSGFRILLIDTLRPLTVALMCNVNVKAPSNNLEHTHRPHFTLLFPSYSVILGGYVALSSQVSFGFLLFCLSRFISLLSFLLLFFFFFKDPPPPEISPFSQHDPFPL